MADSVTAPAMLDARRPLPRVASPLERGAGATQDEWAAAIERMAHDRCATVDDQLAWLRDAGFTEVDCALRDGRFAVLSATRPREP
jgi:hypothetical protein